MTPPVKGGQGRDDDEIGAGIGVTFLVALAFCVGLVIGVAL